MGVLSIKPGNGSRRRPEPAPSSAAQRLRAYHGGAVSDLRSPIDSATGFPRQPTPPYAAASSEISERQRVRKSRRCSAGETRASPRRRTRKYCRSSSNAAQESRGRLETAEAQHRVVALRGGRGRGGAGGGRGGLGAGRTFGLGPGRRGPVWAWGVKSLIAFTSQDARSIRAHATRLATSRTPTSSSRRSGQHRLRQISGLGNRRRHDLPLVTVLGRS
jgi:hypothetical protein